MHLFDLDAIGRGLPVANARAELEAATATGAVVVTAPPGTGKTTFVPALVANLSAGATLLTQPRRVAVRQAARRIAHLDGSTPGEHIGYTVRGEREMRPDARTEVITPGVLLRRLLDDPGLNGVSAVVLDEVHERSVDGDLLLAMLAEVRALREDLVLVAMSATLNTEVITKVLGTAAVVDVPSALHPLRIDYAPFSGSRLDELGVTREYLTHLSATVLRAQAEEKCDALVFVPGAREVDELTRRLRASATEVEAQIDVLPLHGRIPAREQDRAVCGRKPDDPPRIVVSTALAESSLTIPGVRLVVDSGLAREVRRDRSRDMTGLVTVGASRSSADQRAGRAARQAPGLAVRAYSEADYARMPFDTQPEIDSADLTDAALLLAVWGTPGAGGLTLPSEPPEASVRDAEQVLHSLGLVAETGAATALGRQVARLPVGAREARALLEGSRDAATPRLTAEVVAAVSDDYRDPGADLGALLRSLRADRTPGAGRWRREVRRLEALVPRGDGKPARNTNIGAIVALARPERIAKRVGARSFLLASGTRAALPEGSSLVASEWIAVHEVQRAEGRAADGTGAVILLAAALSEADAERIGGVETSRVATVESGKVRVREERRVGAILLSSAPVSATRTDTAPAFLSHLRAKGLQALHWSDAATSLRRRISLVHHTLGKPWPDVSDAALLEEWDTWLAPELDALGPGSSLRDIDVAQALRRLIPWQQATRFDEFVPEQLTVPSGSRVQLAYPDPDTPDPRPVAAVKLQEVFGLAETPRLVDGRVPVLFHLLSPARRPLAVTDDLASFWDGPYQNVRKEMRGRYPKHPWPEDPWSAVPTAHTKKRSGS